MAIVRWQDPFGSTSGPFDDLFNGFLGTGMPLGSHNAPAMDVYTEDDKALVAEVQLSGFTKDDIDIAVNDGVLQIKGEKHDKAEEGEQDKRNYMVRESHASFYRTIVLPRVADGDNVRAEFSDGILKVTVPFKELPQPQRVAITEGKKKK